MTGVKKRTSHWLVLALLVVGITSLACLLGLAIHSIGKVCSGRGLDTFRTVWLVEDNHFGSLIFLAALVVALLVGGALRFREYRKWRALEEKYGPPDDDSA